MSNSKRIEYKTFWSITPAVAEAAVSSLVHTGVVDNWAAALAAGAASAVAGTAAFTLTDTAKMFRGVSPRKKSAIIRWLVAGVSLHASSVQYAIWSIDGSLPSLLASWLVAAGTGVLTFGGAKFASWRLDAIADKTPAGKKETRQVITVENPDPSSDEMVIAKVVASITRDNLGRDRILVQGSRRLRADAGMVYQLRVTSHAEKRFKPDSTLAEQVAIKLREGGKRGLESDFVFFTKGKGAGDWNLTVLERDLMAEVIPYVDDPTPTSIKNDVVAGVTMIGQTVLQSLRQHSRTIGTSTFGKSGLLHNYIAFVTRCVDALLWIGGTWKLNDLVDEWLEPYEGTDETPPIDYIAYNHERVLNMLAGAVRLAKWRQSIPKSQRNWKDIVIILDEVSFAAQNASKYVWVDEDMGECTVSDMISQLSRAAAASGIWVHVASQGGTNTNYGPKGADIAQNAPMVNMFANRDFLEVGRELGNYDLKQPSHAGEYWMLGNDGTRHHMKVPYIQTSDPSKKKLHDGATISQVAWSRRNIHRPGLTEQEGAAIVGDDYLNRPRTVTREYMHAIMTGTDPITVSTTDEIGEAVNELSNDDEPNLESIKIPASRSEKIDVILATAHELGQDGMSPSDISDALNRYFGDDASPDAVSSTLNRMKSDGKADQVKRGLWAIAS